MIWKSPEQIQIKRICLKQKKYIVIWHKQFPVIFSSYVKITGMITKDFKNFFVGCLNEFVRSFRRVSKCLFHVSMMGKIANKIVFVKCLNEEDCKRFCFNFNLFECTFSIWAPVMSVFPTFFSWELQSHFTFYLFGKLCKGCWHRNFILGKGSKKSGIFSWHLPLREGSRYQIGWILTPPLIFGKL